MGHQTERLLPVTDRQTLATAFLNTTVWANAQRGPIAGDASNRRYERLRDPKTGKTAVLMDAPTDKGEDIRPFCHIAEHLSAIGLSPPSILARNDEYGFLLLEDLGDDLVARVVQSDPEQEKPIYLAATDVLIQMHAAPPPNKLAHYDPPFMGEMAALAFTKYRHYATGAAGDYTRLISRFEDILRQEIGGHEVIILRDYHAENLLWLPERDGAKRVGLLDFQDAMLGHPAYDLLSLLQDVRRDVSAATEMAAINHYIAQTGVDDHLFRTAYAVLGAQRHLRVLGVFARLCVENGKPGYVDWIPRTWALLMSCLEHPALAPIADDLRGNLPAPTPETLSSLRSQCPTP